METSLLEPGFAKLAFKLQGHTSFSGLPIAIENRKGSIREGVDKDGKPWRTKFKIPYGYLKGTEGRDGEEIDVYLGPDKKSDKVFVVHQRHITGKGHDEDKVFLGFHTREEVESAYLEHYNNVGKKLLGPVSALSLEELKQKLDEKDHHDKLSFDRAFYEMVVKIAAANPFKGGPGLFQRFGQDLMTGGKALMSPQLTSPGTFTPAGAGRRVVGEMAQSAGHHYAHKGTFANVINPLGGAIGGAAEGLTRATGRELQTAGQQVGGRFGGAMGATGRGLVTAAPHAGMAGEVAGLAGLGGSLGGPLSIQGALGGKLLGAAAPAASEAIHHMGGHLAQHAAHDVVGTASHGIADRARRALGFTPKPVAKPVTGYSMVPPPMGAH
jgi:hypothetical protein